jgi:Family of unknown function (DUF6064)
MQLPSTVEEFMSVFERYNVSVWPAQVGLYFLALIALLCFYRNVSATRRVVFAVLSFLWAWTGLVYHIGFFSSINPLAYIFGGLFVVQSLIFLYFGVIRDKVILIPRLDLRTIFGLLLIFYALIVYPVIGLALGHIYPKSPTFGTPCPTTIFTFGILLFSVKRVPFCFLLIPLLWSLVGFSAAISLGIVEDIGLIVFGVASTTLLTIMKPAPNQKS